MLRSLRIDALRSSPAHRSRRPLLSCAAAGILLAAFLLAPAGLFGGMGSVAAIPPATVDTAGWDGSGGMLAAIAWDEPDAARLAPLEKEGWLLAYQQDFALVLLPPALVAAAEGIEGLQLLEAVSSETGQYFLVLVRDAASAQFEGGARVLARHGHTAIVRTSGDAPRMSAESKAAQPGLFQLVRVTLAPIAWPIAQLEKEPGLPEAQRTDFHPLVDQIVADVSQTEYVALWQTLDDFETRYYNTAANTNSSQWMYDQFLSFGLQAQFHTYNHSGTRRNVVGILPGLVHPEQVVYITGHFDSTSEDPQNHAPGADDNASGTAAFLEAARVLSQYAFQYTVKFVGFNSEEQGLIGSDYYTDTIAAEGEDVIACFNFDMIAYAGTDPAPPDLIIYTNTASLAYAQLLRDACLEYVPTHVEPVIVQEALSGSDHYSFWEHGYLAVLGIEDEAWGSDFCPWYHTADDQIERYPQDFPTYCTMAAIAAVAQTAVPMQPATPYLTLQAETYDDDASGSSQGNGNGLLEFGETIELTLTLGNLGQAGALGVSGTLSCDDPYVTVTAATRSFGNIPAQGTASNAVPFVFTIDADVPDGHPFDFHLAVTEDPDVLDFPASVAAPALAAIGMTIDDQAGGDGDGIAEAGEDLVVTLTLANGGGAAIVDVTGVLAPTSAYLTADPAPRNFGTLASGGSASRDFAVSVSPDAPPLYPASLELAIAAAGGYAFVIPVALNLGDVFAADMEGGAPGWTHAAGGSGYADQWHLETYRNHTYSGAASWKCGGAGAADYANTVYAVLESGPFTLPPHAQITFWHWIEAEVSSSYPGYAYDGGVVEISIDGGAWQRLTPEGGYPYRIRSGGTPGMPAETPVFSGAHGWEQATLDLAAYQGSARLRFIFSTDTGVVAEGWYIDDVQLHFTASDVDTQPVARHLMLHPAQPNPSVGPTMWMLDLPKREWVDARVYDVSGRCLRTLEHGYLTAGPNALTWDGREESGQPVSGGIYWMRVRVGQGEEQARITIVR